MVCIAAFSLPCLNNNTQLSNQLIPYQYHSFSEFTKNFKHHDHHSSLRDSRNLSISKNSELAFFSNLIIRENFTKMSWVSSNSRSYQRNMSYWSLAYSKSSFLTAAVFLGTRNKSTPKRALNSPTSTLTREMAEHPQPPAKKVLGGDDAMINQVNWSYDRG